MSDKSFSKKQIELRITLAEGSFGGKGSEVVINGLPVDVRVTKTGGAEKPSASISVQGLAYEKMEQLTTLAFRPLKSRKNRVAVFAGDENEGLSQVFAGEIVTAMADFNRAPDVGFLIEAISGYYPQLIAAGPQSVVGDAPVADVIKQQADVMGYDFDNQGVTTRIKNCILNGSPMQKAFQAARQCGATLLIDDTTLVLLPPGKEREGDTIVLSDTSGLVGYPTFDNDGVNAVCLYNKGLKIGGQIEIRSVVPKASGFWRIVKLEHSLSAFTTQPGDWFSSISASYLAENTASNQQGTV